MMKTIDDVFNERTCYHYSKQEIDLGLLKEIYDTMKLGPTSANSCPLRVIFVRSKEEKQKLISCVMPGNATKVEDAPVTALFAYDMKFYDKLDILFPHMQGMKDYFSSDEVVALHTAQLNSTLQAAYFMIIARFKGLSSTPMSGFDMNAVNDKFFAGTNHKVSFICCLGYRESDETNPRLPRLDFSDVCNVI